MLELTFGEQVKIVLSRKNMTIKQLAEQIEIKTGVKMSRQNLTQRLGRDNFQEQDMRMIAEILECPFQLNILDVKEPEKVQQVVEKIVEKVVVQQVVEREPQAVEVNPQVVESEPQVVEVNPQVVESEPQVIERKPHVVVQEKPKKEVSYHQREVTVEEVQPNYKRETLRSKEGDINPYTGYEYKSNTVRSHPTRIGYVQVYDRKDHQWTDMTEWAFLGFQERQKLLLGRAYEEPTYLD